jgi:hypothetical protein
VRDRTGGKYPPLPSKVCKVFEPETLRLDFTCTPGYGLTDFGCSGWRDSLFFRAGTVKFFGVICRSPNGGRRGRFDDHPLLPTKIAQSLVRRDFRSGLEACADGQGRSAWLGFHWVGLSSPGLLSGLRPWAPLHECQPSPVHLRIGKWRTRVCGSLSDVGHPPSM